MAAKLVADVCGFLVAAADLDPGFRIQARAYLFGRADQRSAGNNRDYRR